MVLIGANLQDSYLNQLRKDKVPVIIYLTNGVRLKGHIAGFDNFVVVLKESVPQLIYKHAISTIMPQREMDFRGGQPRQQEREGEGRPTRRPPEGEGQGFRSP